MPTSFAPATLAELARRLEHRRHTSDRLASLLRDDAALALEGVDISDLHDVDAPDGGTNDIDRARTLQLARLASSVADDAEVALERLAAGRYGTCSACGERIPLDRLRIVPETDLCVECKVEQARSLDLVG